MSLVFKKKSLKNTGSIIKATEKEMEWVVLVNNKSYYTIQFTFSELNNQKVLKLNELTLLKAKIAKENLLHAFQIENIDFTIKYDKNMKSYSLLAYGIDIENFSEENLKNQAFQQQVKPNFPQFQPNIGGGAVYNNLVRSPQVHQTYNMQSQQQQQQQQMQNANNINRANSFPQQQSQLNAQQAGFQQQQQQNKISQMPVDQQIQNAENLVQMFDDVIDSCKTNKDVIDSDDLKEIKKSILGFQTSLTQCLNYDVSEGVMDRLLKLLDKINLSVKYYDKIISREVVIDKVDFGASRAQFNKQNNVNVPQQNDGGNNQQKRQIKMENNNNGLLILSNLSDSSNSADELADPYRQKVNHQYPQQPESQVLYYEQKQSNNKQQSQVQYPQAPQENSGNKMLFPSLPPQQIKQYPQVKIESVSPMPNNNDSIKNSNLSNNSNNNKSSSQLSEDNQCIICMNEESTHTLIPCGHKKYCGPCAEEMVKQKSCAFCRKPCQQSLRIFD